MASARPRPLSPHLSIWRWRVHAIVSITHRITGNAMAFAAVPIFVWWLVAAATGEEAYATFYDLARGPLGYLFAVGFTWSFFQHLGSGVRHLVMDTGAGFELQSSRRSATFVFLFGVVMTLLFWGAIYLTKGFE